MQKSGLVHLGETSSVFNSFFTVESLAVRADGRDLKLSEFNMLDHMSEGRDNVSVLAD